VNAALAIAGVTARSLLGRRRVALLAILAAMPVVAALLARIGGASPGEALILDTLVIRTVLPLTALIVGTAALGAEMDDGSAVHLLVKPVPRWQVLAAKMAVAVGLTAGLVAASTLLTGLLVGGGRGVDLAIGVTAAVLAGVVAYVALFVAASVVTRRALVLGLFYTLLWEGVLAGILEGTRAFSIREATVGIATALAPGAGFGPGLAPGAALGLLLVVTAGSFVVATMRLERYEIRGD
jgi:ABC-2 type transport system permease protein